MFKPFSSNEETIAPVAWYTSFDSKTLDPRFTVIFTEIVTDGVVSSDETEISIKGIVFFEIGVVPFIDGSIGFEFLVDLLEVLGGTEEIIGTEHHAYLATSSLNTNGFRGLRVTL